MTVTFRPPVAPPLYAIGFEPVPPGAFRVTRSFGDLSFPQYGAHDGLDVGNGRTHDPIVAMAPGRVTYAGFDPNSGGAGIVRIDHGEGWSSGYAHMDRVDVSVGQQVASGQQVGILGSTGWVTAAHLHFDITRNVQRVDPWPLLTPYEDDMIIRKPLVREQWTTKTGDFGWFKRAHDGVVGQFTTAEKVWSTAELTLSDGANARLIEFNGDPLIILRAHLIPIPGTRIEGITPTVADCSAQDAKLTEARLAVSALRGTHTTEGAALGGVAKALGA